MPKSYQFCTKNTSDGSENNKSGSDSSQGKSNQNKKQPRRWYMWFYGVTFLSGIGMLRTLCKIEESKLMFTKNMTNWPPKIHEIYRVEDKGYHESYHIIMEKGHLTDRERLFVIKSEFLKEAAHHAFDRYGLISSVSFMISATLGYIAHIYDFTKNRRNRTRYLMVSTFMFYLIFMTQAATHFGLHYMSKFYILLNNLIIVNEGMDSLINTFEKNTEIHDFK